MSEIENNSLNRPLLSIIIPIYNTKAYLERCVDSVCGQTYENLEILLINDGSTDGTGALCDQLAGKDARIRVLHKENGGSSSARNLGIAQAKGTYFGFVDSDDYVEPFMFETLVTGVEKYQVKLVQIGRDERDEKGQKLPDICTPPKTETQIPALVFLRDLLLHVGDCSFCTKLVHRDLFANRQFPVGELNEDFWLLLQMLEEAEGVLSLPGYGYHVCYSLGSNTRKKEKDAFSRVYWDCVINADRATRLVREYQQKYPEQVGDLALVAMRFGLFQRLEYLLHIPISKMQRENKEYRQVCCYVKTHVGDTVTSPYLTGKNKVYLLLFALAPRTIRVVHGKWKAHLAKRRNSTYDKK